MGAFAYPPYHYNGTEIGLISEALEEEHANSYLIRVNNGYAWTKTDLNFDYGITVVVGYTDEDSSSIVDSENNTSVSFNILGNPDDLENSPVFIEASVYGKNGMPEVSEITFNRYGYNFEGVNDYTESVGFDISSFTEYSDGNSIDRDEQNSMNVLLNGFGINKTTYGLYYYQKAVKINGIKLGTTTYIPVSITLTYQDGTSKTFADILKVDDGDYFTH